MLGFLVAYGLVLGIAFLGSLFYDRLIQRCLDNLTTADKQAMFEAWSSKQTVGEL